MLIPATTYLSEFPDFDPATMPAIPAEWVDLSWHNDACPKFAAPNGLEIFVDYADPAQREIGGARFSVHRDIGSHIEQEYWGDDWSMALAAANGETVLTDNGDHNSPLQTFVRAFCEEHKIECDGDVFALAFSGKNEWTQAEAETIIRTSADAYQLRKEILGC